MINSLYLKLKKIDNEIKPINALQTQINLLCEKSSQPESVSYKVAEKHFQLYIENCYREAQDMNESIYFLDELFNLVSIQQQTQLNYILLLNALKDVYLGDKFIKANRISRDIFTIAPETNPHFWTALSSVLKWLSKCLRSSMQLILQPLRDKMWEWCTSQESNKLIAGLQMLKIFIEHFSISLEEQFFQVQSVMTNSMNSENEEVKIAARNTIIAALNKKEIREHFGDATLCARLNFVLSEHNWKRYDGALDTANVIVSLVPKCIQCFTFTELPLFLFHEKDLKAHLSALKVASFALLTTPSIFTEDILMTIYKEFKSAISKKSPAKNDFILTFGEFLFNRKPPYCKDEEKMIACIRDIIIDNFPNENAVYSLIAISSIDQGKFYNDFSLIFQMKLSAKVVKGLVKYITKIPNKKNYIISQIVSLGSASFLSKPTSEQIILLCQTFVSLEIPYSYFSTPLIYQCVLYMNNTDVDTRKAAISFITYIFKQNQTPDMEQMLLASACTEVSQSLRSEVLKALVGAEIFPECFIYLQTLLHDASLEIQNLALQVLAVHVKDPQVIRILSSYITENISVLKNEKVLSKVKIKCLLMVSTAVGNIDPESNSTLFSTFAPFLIVYLMKSQQKLPTSAILLIAQILPAASSEVDVDDLVDRISDTLSIHTSKKKLDATLDLLISAMKCTTLKISVYNKHFFIACKLLQLGSLTEMDVTRTKLFEAIFLIGSVNIERFHEFSSDKKNKINDTMKTASYFILKSESNKPLDSLIFGSVGVCLSLIFNILSNESLSALYSSAIEALLTIIKVYPHVGNELENFLIKNLNELFTHGGEAITNTLLSNITTLIAVIGNKFTPLVPHVIEFICQRWTKYDKFQLIRITEWLVNSVPEAIEKYIPRIATLFVSNLELNDERVVDAIFSAFVSFGTQLSPIKHIVFPPLLNWVAYNTTYSVLISEILTKLRLIFINAGTLPYTSQIICSMITIGNLRKTLHEKAMDILCVVAAHSGKTFLLYLPRLATVFDIESHQLLSSIIASVEKDLPLSEEATLFIKPEKEHKKIREKQNSIAASKQRDSPSIRNPVMEWDEGQWMQWSNEVFTVLINNSSSRAISACYQLSQRHSAIRKMIYPMALAIYYVANESVKFESLKQLFTTVFLGAYTPRSVIKHFLGAIEILEVLNIRSPVLQSIIADAATNAGVYPQALRASENIFDQGFVQITEKLIILNQNLGLPLAANGVLRKSRIKGYTTMQDVLAERLGLWEDALVMIEKKLVEDPNNEKLNDRKLNCLCELSRYTEIKPLIEDKSSLYNSIVDIHLFDYKAFSEHEELINNPTNNPEGEYYKALLYIMKGEYQKAKEALQNIKNMSFSFVNSLISEDYERSIPIISRLNPIQHINQLIYCKEMQQKLYSPIASVRAKAKEELDNLITAWHEWFKKMNKTQDNMHRFLYISSLLLKPSQLENEWFAFIKKVISSHSFSLADHIMDYLSSQSDELSNSFKERLEISKCRLIYEKSNHLEVEPLRKLIPNIKDEKQLEKACCTLASWINDPKESYLAMKILFETPTKRSIAAYEQWSRINLALYDITKDTKDLITSLNGAMSSLEICTEKPLTLALLVLNILFKSNDPIVSSIFVSRVKNIPIHMWIDILPQIIARLSTDETPLNKALVELLYNIGLCHPHALLYPLMVQYKSENEQRKRIATIIFTRLQRDFPEIVSSTTYLANELMRVAVSWWELAYSQIDDASREFYPTPNYENMLSCLSFIDDILKKNPETCYEAQFMAMYGPSLSITSKLLKDYKETGDEGAIHQAWAELTSVFNKLRKRLQEMEKIPLREASPLLASLKDSALAVPGTFKVGSPIVRVASFKDTLKIMHSKQRPRKMEIYGSDGNEYSFLLKAHEDTRLDERVMQLFTYINGLVEHSSLPMKNRSVITTYKVIPLTSEVGLIGWVQDCATVYELVHEHRKKRGISTRLEMQETQNYAPNFDTLNINDKLAAFRKGLAATDGLDIKRILLSNAPNTAYWLERRTTYASSMAMTSMAGYILGLGDRHLSNIMMGKGSAKLVHIDFGDCFEVAMHRKTYPETVPFRLTRLLVNALEVSRIEGTFRSCCESALEIMRENGEQILGLLEAFIYDPLIQCTKNPATSAEEGIVENPVNIVKRISNKLSGRDFKGQLQLSVQEQVDQLIIQATDERNLCQMFSGWFPWW